MAGRSLSGLIADWAAETRPKHLDDAALAAVKRFLLDTIGCALGGLDTPGPTAARQVATEGGNQPEATVWGVGWTTSMEEAAFLNSLAARAQDYNDIYWQQDPSHPSDLIPGVLAAAEAKHLDGIQAALGIAIAYEVEMRLCEFAQPGIRERKWHHATLTALAMPFATGRMLGLDPDVIMAAAGISGSSSCTLGGVVAGHLSMMKGVADPMAVRNGVWACRLAAAGITGPVEVFEGKEGLMDALGPEWDADVLTAGLPGTGGEPGGPSLEGIPQSDWRIVKCGMKAFPTEALTHAPISCVLHVMADNDLDADEVDKVTVHTLARAADILSDPSKYDPQTHETADHSLPYCLSAAIARGRVTPAEFHEDAIFDPRIRAQLNKIKVLADPEIEALFPGVQRCRVEITTTDGRTLDRQVDWPKGDPRDPLTDEDLRAKFDACAGSVLDEDARGRLWDAIFALEDQADLSAFQALTAPA